MAQVSVNDTPVFGNIGGGGSFTIPSGEVWKVDISFAMSIDDGVAGSITVNGDAMMMGGGGWGGVDKDSGSVNTVFTGGDTIASVIHDGNNNGLDAVLSGFEVSNTVDNTPVSETISPNGSLTIPSGETWVVTIACGGTLDDRSIGELQINGENALVAGNGWGDINNNWAYTDAVLTENDTLNNNTLDGDSNGIGTHIGGFKI